MANNVDFTSQITAFRSAVYGREVRQALIDIAEALETACNNQLLVVDSNLTTSGAGADAAVVGARLTAAQTAASDALTIANRASDIGVIVRGGLAASSAGGPASPNDLIDPGLYDVSAAIASGWNSSYSFPVSTQCSVGVFPVEYDNAINGSGDVYESGLLQLVWTPSNVYWRAHDYVSGSSGTWSAWRKLHLEVDTTLTQSGQAADAATVGNEITDLKSALRSNLVKLNCYNYLDDYSISHYGNGNVTWTKNNNGEIVLSGTTTGLNFINFFSDMNSFPSNLVLGNTYRILYSGTNVAFHVWFYKNGSYLYGKTFTSDGEITIPSDATGAVIRLKIDSGVTVNETVYPCILNSGKKTNKELTTNIDDLIASSIIYRGPLSNSYDISSITDTGVYLLTGNTYAPTSYGTLIHFQYSSSSRVQIIYQYADLNIWYRRGTNSSWEVWQSTDTRYYRNYNYHKKEYLAFGDSLMYGALWNGTAQDPVITRASYGSRIPDRIRDTVHCYTYQNCAVGGMAYTIQHGSTPKFIDYIKEQDISTADLITIAGGRNDGSSQLGTYNSVSGDGTICGAIKEIIEYIRTENPSCQIVVIQVTPYTNSNLPFTATSSAGWSLNDYDEQVSVLCKNMNVGYASWYGCSLFSKWSDFSGGGGNWAHMKDEEQYIQMGNFIAGQVSKYYTN